MTKAHEPSAVIGAAGLAVVMRASVLVLVTATATACAPKERSDPFARPPEPASRPDTSNVSGQQPVEAPGRRVYVQLGADLPPVVAERVRAYLRAAYLQDTALRWLDVSARLPLLDEDQVVLSIGETSGARALVESAERQALSTDGFILRSAALGKGTLVAAIGGQRQDGPTRLGSAYGAYALLEQLGFAFLHPLAPLTPEGGTAPRLDGVATAVDRTHRPRWGVRGLQLHTMHPLELTDLLNGWGPGGPGDAAGFQAQLDEWDSALEWLVANRQNHVQWVLLEARDGAWGTSALSDERLQRLRMLVERAHAFGLRVGIDAPIALTQQNAFRLISQRGELAQELKQVRERLDWLMRAGFDYVSTESGTTEFTHPDPDRMLAWMNEVTRHLDGSYGKRAFIKVHCSPGQVAKGYVDPETQGPLDFNFLPMYADARLGVMPHTVQTYALDDPAPTYGNTSFRSMHGFMRSQAGKRPVLWHPETAYWVSFDVDVPLFLPVYAERRVRDLRLIDADERAGGAPIQGQMLFSSGWEWGYWLNDVVAARAAFDPETNALDENASLELILREAFAGLGKAAPEAARRVAALARLQTELLIEGDVGGGAPADTDRRAGHAYLSGVDTWDDIPDLARSLGLDVPMTQPRRLGLLHVKAGLPSPVSYPLHVAPLLSELSSGLSAAALALEAPLPGLPDEGRALWGELVAAAQVTALRAAQVRGLYGYVDAVARGASLEATAQLGAARDALAEAAALVREREQAYRVPVSRVAGWREGPTVYPYGYLWTARTLYYWWRDEARALEVSRSPCHLNLLEPARVAFGEGPLTEAARLVARVAERSGSMDGLVECLSAPSREPAFPHFKR